MISADDLGRTVKIEMDEGRAASIEDAMAIVSRYRLGIRIAPGVLQSRSATAAALTAMNCAGRAFPGGVFVAASDQPVWHGWGRGRTFAELASHMKATIVDQLPAGLPYTIVIGGNDDDALQSKTLYPTWQGWSGGAVRSAADRLSEDEFQPLSAVLAGALAVSEAFQSVRGFAPAGRRDVGLSLWYPGQDWRAGVGPRLAYLPDALWLLGVGHLGQAYAWSIGWLPYGQQHDSPCAGLRVGIVDPDRVVKGNLDTGLLLRDNDVGERKARVVARELESLGVDAFVVERLFDAAFCRQDGEPHIALTGFDKPEPRRLSEDAGFLRVVDGGIGARSHYLDVLVHAFPSSLRASSAFPSVTREESRALDVPAYAAEVTRRVAEGVGRGDAECGVLEIAGRTVGAAFVGAATSCLVLAEELRALAGGPRFEVVSLSLKDPLAARAVMNETSAQTQNPGFVPAA
jgi:hypothetical protein